MKEIITHTDPDDPLFGTTDEIDHPDPPAPAPDPVPTKADLLAQIQALLDAVNAMSS